MNNDLTTNHLTIRSASLVACLALLFAGATACGNEAAPSARAGDRPRAATSNELIESAKSQQGRYLQQLLAQAEAARGSDRSGDGRGQSHRQKRHDGAPTRQHAPGYNKALMAER